MENEPECKCTNHLLIGVLIGAIVFGGLAVGLFIFDSATDGNYMALVARQAPSPTTKTTVQKATIPEVTIPAKKETYFFPALINDGNNVSDAVGPDTLINDCTSNCVAGSEQCTNIDEFGNGAIASGQNECEQCCTDLVQESTLSDACDYLGGTSYQGEVCENGPEISGCETWRCMDCPTKAISYVDVDDCWDNF
ncbi:hypothetical protein KKC88_03460 [Patescibacteria group bacterium]|nr:hypothetical protein [Patescibacteria group bacterium]MBU1673570.1 hypothetical protein [Patescibacteria group bacterium]MBU1963648.1 hypothetical protein [Patescibacteria group bacterium]